MQLIYCHGRSGSTQLVRCVRNYKSDSSNFYDEPFKQKNAVIHGFDEPLRDGGNLERYIDHLGDTRVKHLWSDLALPMNKRVIANPGVESILFLYRRNMFDFAMSMLTASLTKEWHGASETHYGEMPLHRLESVAIGLMYDVPVNARLVRDFAQAPVTCVAYEDLYGFSGSDVQAETAKQALGALGINDEASIRLALADELSPQNKYKDHSYYERIFSNYADTRAVIDPIAKKYLSRDEDRPESILDHDQRPSAVSTAKAIGARGKETVRNLRETLRQRG